MSYSSWISLVLVTVCKPEHDYWLDDLLGEEVKNTGLFEYQVVISKRLDQVNDTRACLGQ